MSRLGFAIPAMVLLLLAGLLAFAACDGDDSAPATPTAGDAVTPGGPSEPTATLPPFPTTDPEFQGGRDPVEKPGFTGESTPFLTLVSVDTQNLFGLEPFDRVMLGFAGGLPGIRVEYVSPPIVACGSGAPVTIAGEAFLQVRLTPAAAHNERGEATFRTTELTPDLPTIVEAKQTCDFEGEVTWVIGLREEVDFNVFPLGEPFSNAILVDVAHP